VGGRYNLGEDREMIVIQRGLVEMVMLLDTDDGF
jgi:hypothetical protein